MHEETVRGFGWWRRAAAGAALVLLAAALVSPDDARGTSLFSMNLLGEKLESGDVRAIALGGATQLLTDSLGVLQLNPALMARLGRVVIGTSQLVALDEGRSTDFTERDISFKFSALRGAFPIADLFVFSLGYVGRYDPDGSFSERDVTAAGDPFTTTLEKSGGLFSVPVGVSFNLSKYASVGLVYSFEQGFIQERVDTRFDDPTFTPGAGIKREEFSSNGFSGGLVLFPTRSLMIGGMYESEIDYDSDITEKFTQTVLDTAYSSSATLPSRTNVGLTWRMSGVLTLHGSAAWRDFADFKGLAFPLDRLRREESYAFGAEYTKGVPFKGRRYPLRVSVAFSKLPYEHPVGETVNKFVIGFGTGIRLGGGKGKLDIAFRVGKVGSIDGNNLEDRIFRVYLGISGSEVWRRKAGRDY